MNPSNPLINPSSLAIKKIAILEEYVRYLKFKRFGKSSERFEADEQESLLNEAEQLDDIAPQEDETIAIAADVDQSASEIKPSTNSIKAAPGRRKLPASFPRFKVIHELPVENRLCSCGCELQAFDEVISEQVGSIPAELYVILHGRKKYRCNACVDKAQITAPMPAQPFPKTNASPELMAEITVSKFLDGLPFYRQEQI